jgi:aspartate kinase
MIVVKFGGTSVGTATAIQATADIVRGRLPRSPVVVVSALGGVTTELLALAEQATAGQLLPALQGIERLRARHLSELQALLGEESTSEHQDDAGRGQRLARLDETSGDVSVLCDELAQLLEALSILGHLTPRSLDAIAATGELLSVQLVVAAYEAAGLPAVAVDPRRVLITDASFTRAQPIAEAIKAAVTEHIAPVIAAGRVPVIGGFVGATKTGITTTLGRGGSDYTASLLGAALGAKAIEIWTDVDGMLTADPRVVPEARLIERIRFDEASELATFGAKVLHPSTIAPAVGLGIPVFIYNTRHPDGVGTQITFDAPRRALAAIAGKCPVTLLKIRSPSMLLAPGFLRRVYEVFERHRISVDVVATSEVSISLTVDRPGGHSADGAIEALVGDLAPLGDVTVEPTRGVVALVGAGLADDTDTMARALDALKGTRIHMLSLSATGLNFTAVIDASEVASAMRRLHDAFFPAPPKAATLIGDAGERALGSVERTLTLT